MKIAFDLDNVIFPTSEVLLGIWSTRYISKADVALYDFGDQAKMMETLAIFTADHGYRKLKCPMAVVHTIAGLNADGHHIVFATDRPVDSEVYEDTVACLEQYDLYSKDDRKTRGDLLFTDCPVEPGSKKRSKYRALADLGVDLLVEDHPAILAEAKCHGMKTLTFDQPWNGFIAGPRAEGWTGERSVKAALNAPGMLRR